MHVALYARVSTADKDQNPETQLRPLREHLLHLQGATDAGAFVDHASADNLRGRKEWRRLLELARRRQHPQAGPRLIVVWKLDRAFRSVLDGASTLQMLTACGCGLRSLQEPWIDTTTAIGEALYHITLAWAQLEKRQIAERVKAGMDRARAEGTHVGRPRRTAPVTAHPSWPKVLVGIQAGHLTRTEAARKLHVRRARLWRRPGSGVPKEVLWDSAGVALQLTTSCRRGACARARPPWPARARTAGSARNTIAPTARRLPAEGAAHLGAVESRLEGAISGGEAGIAIEVVAHQLLDRPVR